MEGVGVVVGLSDDLAGAGAEQSLSVWDIVCRVSAPVFAASTASWYCLSNLFNIQELVMCPSLLQYVHNLYFGQHLLLV